MVKSRHAEEILEQGYTVFESAWSPEEVEFLREVVLGRLDEANPPVLWTPEDKYVPIDDKYAGVHHVGVGFYQLLIDRPQIIDTVLKRRIIEHLQEVLGEDLILEFSGAVVTDRSRPFLPWHSHIGGHEAGFDPERTGWPLFERCDRVTTLLYLDGSNDENGCLLVLPRKVTDPTEPPHDVEVEWDEQVEVHVPPGSMVVLEQSLLHAARPMQRDGHRIFMPSYFRRRGVPEPWGSRSLHHTDDYLARVLERCLSGESSAALGATG